jgi:hypothetical protein
MTTWNYRILHYVTGGYMLREVFYDEDGKPSKHGYAGIERVLFDEPKEIEESLALMMQACQRPVLQEYEIGVKP